MSALVGRSGALLAVCSAVLHGASLGPANPRIAVLTVAMIIGCLYCAYELLTRDTVRSWVLVAMMNLVMIGAHLPMPGGHHHGVGTVGGSAASPMQLATVVAIGEVLLAVTVLFVRTRALTPAVVGPCQSGPHDSGTTGRSAGRDLDRLPEPN
jgi:hypothetical protein